MSNEIKEKKKFIGKGQNGKQKTNQYKVFKSKVEGLGCHSESSKKDARLACQ